MSQEDQSFDTRELFGIVGPQITESEIDAVFPEKFPDRDALVQFYLRHNGGGRTEQSCIVHCGNPEHKVSRDDLERITIEGFFSISSSAEERMLPFAPMLRHRASRIRTFAEIPEMTEFLQKHMPIAFDHCGDDFWIDTKSGRIDYVLWDSWKEGPIEIASSFSDFVSKFWSKGDAQESRSVSVFETGIDKFERVTGLKYVMDEHPSGFARDTRKSRRGSE
jgi:hypothetical protein